MLERTEWNDEVDKEIKRLKRETCIVCYGEEEEDMLGNKICACFSKACHGCSMRNMRKYPPNVKDIYAMYILEDTILIAKSSCKHFPIIVSHRCVICRKYYFYYPQTCHFDIIGELGKSP